MSDQAFRTVRTARTEVEAGLLISVLQQSGLHPLELGTAGHYSLAGADIEYSVQVPSEEATEARQVHDAYERG